MVALKPLITSTPDEFRAGLRPFDGYRAASWLRSSGDSFERSSHIRARQKLSSPSSISRVKMPSTSVTTAPADLERLGGLDGDLAHVFLQRLADAEIEHQADAQFARRFVERLPVDVMSAGRLMPSRRSGFDSTHIISAASSTVRVIGPATRPT